MQLASVPSSKPSGGIAESIVEKERLPFVGEVGPFVRKSLALAGARFRPIGVDTSLNTNQNI